MCEMDRDSAHRGRSLVRLNFMSSISFESEDIHFIIELDERKRTSQQSITTYNTHY